MLIFFFDKPIDIEFYVNNLSHERVIHPMNIVHFFEIRHFELQGEKNSWYIEVTFPINRVIRSIFFADYNTNVLSQCANKTQFL